MSDPKKLRFGKGGSGSTLPTEIVPPTVRNQPLRPQTRASLRTAVNAKCRECIYDPRSGAGTWREQVTACTSRTCPLFSVRPTTSQTEV